MAMALLEVEDLSVAFAWPGRDGGRACVLDGVDFTVEEGRSLGLVGESGCGKSMTALAIMGLLPPGARASGKVLFEGQDLLTKTDRQLSRLRGRSLAMIFQEPAMALNPVATIGAQVAEGARLHLGLTRAQAHERAAAMLDRVGLPPARFSLDRYPHELSGGQCQRVMISMALICSPKLLIADEPTTALDVTTQAQILDLLAEIADEEAMALLMITHDLAVVAEMTDAMVVMYAGAVAEAGPTPKVFAKMAHPYTARLFDAMPSIGGSTQDPASQRLRAIPGQVPGPGAPRIGCRFAARCAVAGARCRASTPPRVEVEPGHLSVCFRPGG
ncbi:MAG: ABC transporter ATP-binding protein [Hyphomicrobiales bacterium]